MAVRQRCTGQLGRMHASRCLRTHPFLHLQARAAKTQAEQLAGGRDAALAQLAQSELAVEKYKNKNQKLEGQVKKLNEQVHSWTGGTNAAAQIPAVATAPKAPRVLCHSCAAPG